MAHPGDLMARDFLKLEAHRQKLEIAQWQSLEGIRCRHAVAEAQKVAVVEQLDRRLEHGERERERTMERNQIIREQATLFQRQAGSQVAIVPPGGRHANMFIGSAGGAIMGKSEAVERLRDSREMFAGQVERMSGQWHQVIEDQMRDEIKMTRTDSATCKVRQNEMLQAACRQEHLLQELVIERRRMQDERSKMYALDRELAERNKTLRDKLELEREAIDASLLQGAHPADGHIGSAVVARSMIAREAKDQLALAMEPSVTAGEQMSPSMRHLPNSKVKGHSAGLLSSSTTIDSVKGYVPATGTRQFEVYQRLKQYEDEMQCDLRLLEAAPLPVLLRETPVPKSDSSLHKQKFEPGTGAPLVIIPPPLETTRPVPKEEHSHRRRDNGGGTGDVGADDGLASRMHGVVEQSLMASFLSDGVAQDSNESIIRQTPLGSTMSEQRLSTTTEQKVIAESQQRPPASMPASPNPLADLMAYTHAPPRRLNIGMPTSNAVPSEPISSDVLAQPSSTINSDVLAQPITTATAFLHEREFQAGAPGSFPLQATGRVDWHTDAYDETDKHVASGNLGTSSGPSGFSRGSQGPARPIPPPLALDTASVTTPQGATPRQAGSLSAVVASSTAVAAPQVVGLTHPSPSSVVHSSTSPTMTEGPTLELQTRPIIDRLASGTPASTASMQAVVQDAAALHPGPAQPPVMGMQNQAILSSEPTQAPTTGAAFAMVGTPTHSHLAAMTPFSPAVSHSGDQNLLAYSGDLVSSGEPNMDLWIPDTVPDQPLHSKEFEAIAANTQHAIGHQPPAATKYNGEGMETAKSPKTDTFEAVESGEHTTPSFLQVGSGSESVIGDIRRAPHPSDTFSLSASATDAGSFLHSFAEGPHQSVVPAGIFGSQGLQPSLSINEAAATPAAQMANAVQSHMGTPMSSYNAGCHSGTPNSMDNGTPLGAKAVSNAETAAHQADPSRVPGWWRDHDTRPMSWGRGSGANTPNSLASAAVNTGGHAAVTTPQNQGGQSEAVGAGSLDKVDIGGMAVSNQANPFSRQRSPTSSETSSARRRQDAALAAIAAGIDPLAKQGKSSDHPLVGGSGSYQPRQNFKAPWDTGGGLQSGANAAELDDDEVQGSESEGKLETALRPSQSRIGSAPAQQAAPTTTSTVGIVAPTIDAKAQAGNVGRSGAPPALNSFDLSPGADELSDSEDVLKASVDTNEGSGSFQKKGRANPLARGGGRNSSLRPGFLAGASNGSLGSFGSDRQDSFGGTSAAARGKAKAKAKGAMNTSSAAFVDTDFDELSSPSKFPQASSWMRPKAKAKSKFGSSSLAAALGGEIDWKMRDAAW